MINNEARFSISCQNLFKKTVAQARNELMLGNFFKKRQQRRQGNKLGGLDSQNYFQNLLLLLLVS